ncbi:MAG: flagellar export chaperone FliS [Gemmatimonadaceae bacterium]|jgi:flagellar protein FliS|nr:flagellar export chaperone FliS [Gemmatimonadaceae bacterium]
MSYASQASNYRELEVLSASPERLVVLLYDGLVVQLERARLATERQHLEGQVVALSKARAIVGELLATLDFEQGGEIADRLASIYQYLLLELVDVGRRGDTALMRRLGGIAAELRDGFAGAAEQVATVKLSA